LSEAERGLLLLRVRDEIKMTIAAYQTLYQSSVTFAMRKQLQAEHGKADLEKRITELEAKKTKQSNKVIELKSKLEAIERRNQERKE
jgi:dynein light intermediate chain